MVLTFSRHYSVTLYCNYACSSGNYMQASASHGSTADCKTPSVFPQEATMTLYAVYIRTSTTWAERIIKSIHWDVCCVYNTTHDKQNTTALLNSQSRLLPTYNEHSFMYYYVGIITWIQSTAWCNSSTVYWDLMNLQSDIYIFLKMIFLDLILSQHSKHFSACGSNLPLFS